jgi:hypothetical protein
VGFETGSAKGTRRFRDRANQRRVAIDRHGQRGTARKRFQRQCAAARVQIERRELGQVLSEPVEQGLAHPIGCGPQAFGTRETG